MAPKTPGCPGCGAKFSIKQGSCTKCGLPEWQFVGIEDPMERGRAIARWKRTHQVVTDEFVAKTEQKDAKRHDVPRALSVAKPTKKMRHDARHAGDSKASRNKHGRVGVRRGA